MSVTVRIIRDSKFAGVDALARRLGAGLQRELVGVPAGPAEADGTSLASVALWTEFGRHGEVEAGKHGPVQEHQPERPFMRMGIRSGLPEIRRVAKQGLAAVAEGSGSIDTVLGRMGEAGAGAIKRYMTGDHFAPNAPSTVAKKGSSQPTIDSASLRNSVTHVPEKS